MCYVLCCGVYVVSFDVNEVFELFELCEVFDVMVVCLVVRRWID